MPRGEESEARRRFGDLAEVVTPPRPLRGVPGRLETSAARVFAVTLPADVVAYFDADTVLCRPAPELWEVAPGTVNAVTDRSRQVLDWVHPDLRADFLRAFPTLSRSQGFNSGVFALAPRDWPDLPERFEAALACFGPHDYGKLFDQPLLNAVFEGRTRRLPFAFNAHYLFEEPIPADVRVVHFTSAAKPWNGRLPRHEPAYNYWVRHGLGECSWPRLLRVRLGIWMHTPRRWLHRALRARRGEHGVHLASLVE